MPQERLNKALYVLNFLRLTGEKKEPPALIHHRVLMEGEQKQEKVLVQGGSEKGECKWSSDVPVMQSAFLQIFPHLQRSRVGRDSCSPSRRFVLHRKANIVYPTYQRFFELQ